MSSIDTAMIVIELIPSWRRHKKKHGVDKMNLSLGNCFKAAVVSSLFAQLGAEGRAIPLNKIQTTDIATPPQVNATNTSHIDHSSQTNHLLQIRAEDPGLKNQWHHLELTEGGANTKAAQRLATGQGVVVGILDEAIGREPSNSINPEIKDKIVDIPQSWHRTVPNTDIFDDDVMTGSTTGHSASVIAGGQNNGIDGAGVAPNAKLMLMPADKSTKHIVNYENRMRWMSGINIGSNAPLNQNPVGVLLATANLGRYCSSSMQRAIDDVTNQGTIIIAPAGPSGNQRQMVPSMCNNVISVGSATVEGKDSESLMDYNSRVDILAPGGDQAQKEISDFIWASNITSTQMVGQSGAKPAAAITAGVVALMKQVKPDLTVNQALEAIRATAAELPSPCSQGNGKCGAGRLDAKAALDYVQNELGTDKPSEPTPEPTPEPNPQPTPEPKEGAAHAVQAPLYAALTAAVITGLSLLR